MAHFLIPRTGINSNYARAVHASPFSKRFLCQGFCQCLRRRRDEVAAADEIPHCQRSASRASGGLFIRRCHDRLVQLQWGRRRATLRAFHVSLMGSHTCIITHHVTRWRVTICPGSTWCTWLRWKKNFKGAVNALHAVGFNCWYDSNVLHILKNWPFVWI